MQHLKLSVAVSVPCDKRRAEGRRQIRNWQIAACREDACWPHSMRLLLGQRFRAVCSSTCIQEHRFAAQSFIATTNLQAVIARECPVHTRSSASVATFTDRLFVASFRCYVVLRVLFCCTSRHPGRTLDARVTLLRTWQAANLQPSTSSIHKHAEIPALPHVDRALQAHDAGYQGAGTRCPGVVRQMSKHCNVSSSCSLRPILDQIA
jgi:hypothetical protein